MAKAPDDVMKRANSIWNQHIAKVEAEIDVKIDNAKSLPIHISIPISLDKEQRAELIRRYKAAGWQAKVENHAGDRDDPSSSDWLELVLNVG